jgi:hypothetical protein
MSHLLSIKVFGFLSVFGVKSQIENVNSTEEVLRETSARFIGRHIKNVVKNYRIPPLNIKNCKFNF